MGEKLAPTTSFVTSPVFQDESIGPWFKAPTNAVFPTPYSLLPTPYSLFVDQQETLAEVLELIQQ